MGETVSDKTILVTGANRGIGLELARQFSRAGNRVFATCRKSSPELSELGVDVIDGVDVGSESGAARLAEQLGDQKIDWLVNNAGVLAIESLENLDFDAIEHQFRVNTLGPLRITAALLENLRAGSKVFVITSNMGSIGDNTSGGYYGYRISKAGVNMAFKSLSVDLQDRGISVFMLHPGWVATDMSNFKGPVPVEQSASRLIARMTELGPEQTGAFRHAKGHVLQW